VVVYTKVAVAEAVGVPSKEWAEVVMFVAPALAAQQVEAGEGFREEEVAVAVEVVAATAEEVVAGGAGKIPSSLV
jgi:hypothetical protein